MPLLTSENNSSITFLRAPWIMYSLLTVLLWGLWGLESKFVVDRMSPWLNQIVFSFGLLPPVLWILLSRRQKHRPAVGAIQFSNRRGAIYGLLTGVLGGGGNIGFYLALSHGGKASIVVPLVGLAPLVTVLLALLFLKESLNRIQLIGLFFALVSIFLLSL